MALIPRAETLIAAGSALLFLAALGPAQGPRPERPARSQQRPVQARAALEVGSIAPEFTLMPLGKEGSSGSDAEGVRLSQFRGKAPVCLFFSSYT